MVAYNFQSQFAPMVESGDKRQTIRANGKRRHARVGEHVQLYTGMRTKACRKLITPDPVCKRSDPVFITCGIGAPAVMVAGEYVRDLNAFARRDGFADFDAMFAWFQKTHGLPFDGTLIGW